MADLQKQYEELMKLVTEERALQKKAEEALAVAKQATELAAATAADNIAKANAFAAQVSAAAIQKGPISSVDPEEQRPNAGSTKSGSLEWVDQFVKKLFQAKEISYDQDFAKAFVAMYFDTEKKTKAEASLCKLKQTKSTADYTHLFNTHTQHTGWETATLISHYKQGLKSNV
ncbi:hypothetical protein Pst134EA_025553 [Puccinia striiformis f. sp. tritici]|uniref:hypothetical protein n=1 Tax=Puccinia striiformis f. sp. tritici TaxID=168172 RepID=UPI002008310A|nr:hypothetical protein Pst134EA_025553 [Puccinia striiformis f. sp. tritici]KAH9451605.1 hypothetical protein Pst134EA_025553 [Puccinia striiformis f. sp. tritici]